MRIRSIAQIRVAAFGVLAAFVVALAATELHAQSSSVEREFPQSKATVERALRSMQTQLAGRLPVLDGFATADNPLERYQRAYYQAATDVSDAAGGSRVRISVKVTAWYNDPSGSHSGYALLTSNGRLEADLLDQLNDQIVKNLSSGKKEIAAAAKNPAVATKESPKSSSSPASAGAFSSSWKQSLAAQERSMPRPTGESVADKSDNALQSEADSLEQILKNQSHPKNLVAVKKSGTPVVATPSLNAKPLFLASMHDEFEMLDFNPDWVHVRISGLSRGWIWRNSLEMPDGIPDTAANSGPSPSPAADLFHVTREETAPFPGDWEPLRGKTVKIVSVQKADDKGKDGGAQDKLEYAKYLLEKNYPDLSQKSQELAGVVLIFDAADGGMIAATVATLQQWKSGTLSDSALWHKCFFDPPETFSAGGTSSAQ